MTPTKPKNGNGVPVEHVALPDGGHSIGLTLEGVFVPFVTLDSYRVAALVENAQDRAKLATPTTTDGSAA